MTRTTGARATKRTRAASGPGDATDGSSHVTSADGNVFADLGFARDEAENLRIRAQLMARIRDLIVTRRLTQTAAGELLGVSQPRVSDLRRGKIGLFTIDALVNMLAHAGLRVRVQVEPTRD
jgi:predicted XRE-type DNA-binding protein